ACGNPELKKVAYEAWRKAGLPTQEVVIAGSKHGDWAPNPTLASGNPATPELASWYSVAWFDRWLLGDRSAEQRLYAQRFSLFDHYQGPFALDSKTSLDTTFASSADTVDNHC